MIGFSFNLVYQSLNVIAGTKNIHAYTHRISKRSQKSSEPIELGGDVRRLATLTTTINNNPLHFISLISWNASHLKWIWFYFFLVLRCWFFSSFHFWCVWACIWLFWLDATCCTIVDICILSIEIVRKRSKITYNNTRCTHDLIVFIGIISFYSLMLMLCCVVVFSGAFSFFHHENDQSDWYFILFSFTNWFRTEYFGRDSQKKDRIRNNWCKRWGNWENEWNQLRLETSTSPSTQRLLSNSWYLLKKFNSLRLQAN